MPKLIDDVLAQRRQNIVAAARPLFLRLGFHGTSLRDVAAAAAVSVGNVYTYFPSKEAIFERVLGELREAFSSAATPMAPFFAQPTFPDHLEDFGNAVGAMVEQHRDYLLLLFVDVVELSGRHAASHYAHLAERFRGLLGAHFDRLRAEGRIGGVDPVIAFAAVYMQFFNYFMIERLFRAERHLGASDQEVVRELSRLFRLGLLPRDGGHDASRT